MISYYVGNVPGAGSANRTFDRERDMDRFIKDNNITRGTVFCYIPSGLINTLTRVRDL
jgi:hypothetical protein